jgi:hypothetical protein
MLLVKLAIEVTAALSLACDVCYCQAVQKAVGMLIKIRAIGQAVTRHKLLLMLLGMCINNIIVYQ